MTTRNAYVAGRFYPNNAVEMDKLMDQIYQTEKELFLTDAVPGTIIGGVIPHAGYVYSGYHAMHFFELLKNSNQSFDTVVIVNPNHTGYGEYISLDTNKFWETPYGNVEVDQEFCKSLDLPFSNIAHKFEHSGEVILPFLQKFMNNPFKIVPISMLKQKPENAQSIAKRVHEQAIQNNRKILFLASSDFSHHVSVEYGREQDEYVLAKILELDTNGVYDEVMDHDISVCGFGPIMSLIEYAKLTHNNPVARILRRGHSGEMTGSDDVVDYVSLLLYGKEQF